MRYPLIICAAQPSISSMIRSAVLALQWIARMPKAMNMGTPMVKRAVVVAAPAPAKIRISFNDKKRPLRRSFFYLPRRYEITAPKKPNKPRPRIKRPIGTFVVAVVGPVKDGRSRGGGGVKVGKRVTVCWPMNAASSVGLMVGVENGVGVGGTSTIGSNAPGERDTCSPHTQPIEPGTPG